MAKTKVHDDAKKEDIPKVAESAPAKEQAIGPAVKKGDVIKLDYDAWRLDPDGEHLFDTTNEASAKEAEISKDGIKYAPVPMVVGVARVFAGLDKALAGAKVGEEKIVMLDPLEGAGAKEPTNYKYYPFREFEKRKIDIEMGKEVVIDNKIGYITAITAGRVKVDFNQPLAGKKLKYKFKVAAVLDKLEEKVPAVIEMDYGTSEGFEVRKEGENGVEIVLPDLCKYDNKWVLARFRIVSDLREYLNLASIKFIEIYVKKEEKKEHAADCKDPECKDPAHEKSCEDPECKDSSHKHKKHEDSCEDPECKDATHKHKKHDESCKDPECKDSSHKHKGHEHSCEDPECKDATHEHAGHDHSGHDHKH